MMSAESSDRSFLKIFINTELTQLYQEKEKKMSSYRKIIRTFQLPETYLNIIVMNVSKFNKVYFVI